MFDIYIRSFKVICIFQGSGRLENILLPCSRSQVSCVLSHWTTLQNQTYIMNELSLPEDMLEKEQYLVTILKEVTRMIPILNLNE